MEHKLTQNNVGPERDVVDVLRPPLGSVVVPPGVAHHVAFLHVVAQVEAEVEVVLGKRYQSYWSASQYVYPSVMLKFLREVSN